MTVNENRDRQREQRRRGWKCFLNYMCVCLDVLIGVSQFICYSAAHLLLCMHTFECKLKLLCFSLSLFEESMYPTVTVFLSLHEHF